MRRLLGVLSLLVVVLIQSGADAHEIYIQKSDGNNFWEGKLSAAAGHNDNLCFRAQKVEISHGTGWGHSRVEGIALDLYSAHGVSIKCEVGWSRPPGTLAVRGVLYKWHANTNQYAICRKLNWKLSSGGSATPYVEQLKTWGQADFCGNGKYTTVGYGAIWIGDQWENHAPNGFYPGNHYLWDD